MQRSAVPVGQSVSGKITLTSVNWHSNHGCQTGTKVTSEPGGFTLTTDLLANELNAAGTLSTTIDGKAYRQPANGT